MLLPPVGVVSLFVLLNLHSVEDRIDLDNGPEVIVKSHGFPLLAMQELRSRDRSETNPKDKHFDTTLTLPNGASFEIKNQNALIRLPGFPAQEIQQDAFHTFVLPDRTSIRVDQSNFIVTFFRQTPIYLEKETGKASFQKGAERIWRTEALIVNTLIGCLAVFGSLLNVIFRVKRGKEL
jgi:hypothetical protein